MRLLAVLIPLLAGCNWILPLGVRAVEPGEDLSVADGPAAAEAQIAADAPPLDLPQLPDRPLLPDAPPVVDSQPQPDGPSTGPLTCSGYTMPAISKACTFDYECVAVLHQINCCGTAQALGINIQGQTLFATEEAACAATYPGCGCATGPTQTDDGSSIFLSKKAGAVCVNGVCTSFVPECMEPCLVPGTTCKTCTTTGGNPYGECSTSCLSNTDCSSAQPYCLASSFGSFCSSQSVSCN